MEIIREVRSRGYARTAGDMTEGQAVLAVSIPAPVGKMPMAVGVGGKIERIAAKEDRILSELRAFKEAVSTASA